MIIKLRDNGQYPDHREFVPIKLITWHSRTLHNKLYLMIGGKCLNIVQLNKNENRTARWMKVTVIC